MVVGLEMGKFSGAWRTPGQLTVIIDNSVIVKYCDVITPALLHSFSVLTSGDILEFRVDTGPDTEFT